MRTAHPLTLSAVRTLVGTTGERQPIREAASSWQGVFTDCARG